MKTIQLEINFPLFEGFYNSYLDLSENIEVGEDESYSMTEEQFDNIDWNKTNENVSKFYLNYFKDELSDFFKSIGILSFLRYSSYSSKYLRYLNSSSLESIKLNITS